MRRTCAFLVIVISSLFWLSARANTESPLVVHEWGTFTSLQNESGSAISRIDRAVEPLPPFVVNLIPDVSFINKGAPQTDSISDSVTMRLETPVVYFHLPPGSAPMKLSFAAQFNGGLLSQYYPNASESVVGRQDLPTSIDGTTQGHLEWRDFTIGKPATLMQTDSQVWLAPRKVDALDVTTPAGQSERYLFYRGVGHLDAPISVVRRNDTLQIYGESAETKIDTLWYFDVRPDGTSAFRKLSTDGANSPTGMIAATSANFAPDEYRADAMSALRSDMKRSLMTAGLFDDEAQAMLDTWENAYFKTVGTRVFFIVPRTWTDAHLPISVSAPAKIERVMMGRIDLVTPRQRTIATQLLRDPADPNGAEMLKALGRFSGAILTDTANLLRDQAGIPRNAPRYP
jgi:hypothetical protein